MMIISMLPLILQLLLLWLQATLTLFTISLDVCASSSSSVEANSSILLSPDPLKCTTNIPYPFGISGKALKGFEVSCIGNGNGTSPYLQLNNRTNYLIERVSLPQGFVIISFQVAVWTCAMNLASPWPFSFNLSGTPYTVSANEEWGNMLTTVGCGVLGTIQGLEEHQRSSTSGCVSFCTSLDFTIDKRCTGLGCCQASIPQGLKGFKLTFNNFGNLTGLGLAARDRSLVCGQTFLVRRNNFTFSKDALKFMMNVSKPLQRNFSIVLDWAIGSEMCEKAMKDLATYACKNNSKCYNSRNGVGYLCNCSQGYEGNPYAKDGCTDINECNQSPNPCKVGVCINEPGSFSCPCPPGQDGDGKVQGGCRSSVLMKRRSTVPMELGLGLGLCLFLILIIGCLWTYWFSKKRKLTQMKAKFFEQNGGLFLQQQILSQGSDAIVKIFSMEELEKATNNFNESQILGCGGYGTVYKGVLSNQKVVAIKKSKLVDGSQIEQFINEIIILSQIKHRNVVKLLGCCLETQVPLLVYEFISNGTLFHLIQGKNHNFSMSWKDRLRIATEIAGALAYLHSATSIPIIHRDVKSTNILLDENYTAKVSDFGASRSVPFDQTHVTTLVQGTFGYLDPEYFHTSQLTEKSDVYSFGVVLVELLTSEIPISFARSEDQRNLSTYFQLMFDGQCLLQLIKPQIVQEAEMEQLFFVAQLARRCLHLKGEERPTMKEIAMELEGLTRLQKEQLAPQNLEEIEPLLDGMGLSNGCIEEENKQ